ncbi:MAG: DUF1995 family protein [Leptolyngbyaceae cyanobacterium MO_188.B28]|nr:DUF1995 family protein [Leptolyngbyaceae cyanobacterium MO_188.B28]
MAELPKSLEDAVEQAKGAVQAALNDGYTRLQVELVFPEIRVMPLAQQFYPVFQEMGLTFKVYFPDAGAAALARRDWGDLDFTVRGMGELKGQMEPDDQAYLLVEPSAVEVEAVEKMCNQAGERPVVLFTPKLEDIAIVGIGYAARKVRERFLKTLESCYYLRPIEGAAILRCYPEPWQVWRETEGGYDLLAEFPERPVGEVLANLFMDESAEEPAEGGNTATPVKSQKGFFSGLQQLIRALNQ